QCITISGTIGLGLSVDSGEVLRVACAGPGGAITAFAIVSFIAVLVMAGLKEMLASFPLPNAMAEYVKVFVDEDLGTVVGITYWY
ncbi:hypothetical protein K440DRAFT_491895, partial [Wilcoxina mikolae CBS 423.85]